MNEFNFDEHVIKNLKFGDKVRIKFGQNVIEGTIEIIGSDFYGLLDGEEIELIKHSSIDTIRPKDERITTAFRNALKC